MCGIDCPVSINTGDLVERLRMENHSPGANRMALKIAQQFKHAEWLIKFGVNCGTAVSYLFGAGSMYKITYSIKK